MKQIKVDAGITLLEMVLVLVVASSILVLGLAIYSPQRKQLAFQQLTYNVNTLLQALGQYYRANCNVSSSGLYPSSSPPTNPYAFAVNHLQLDGFINLQNLTNNSPLLDNSGDTPTAPYSAYILQFNPMMTTQETINACSSATNCTTTSSNPNTANTNVFSWNVQVAVKVAIPNGANQTTIMNDYKNILGADCTSVLSNGVVTPCATAPTGSANNYLVFARIPSFASADTTSVLWQTMPNVKQFNLQYTHDQMYELMNAQPTYAGSVTNQYYYLCGG